MIRFIIPAYNEQENIASLLRQTAGKMHELGLDFKIYVINDGSTDGTAEIVRELGREIPVALINQARNQGVGEAFRVGFRHALTDAAGEDIIVTKEADNTSDLTILEKMISRIREGDDVVLASCFCEGGKVINSTWDRHLLSFCANTLVKIVFRMNGIHTFSSFYRAFKSSTLKKAFRVYDAALITRDGFECMVQMLIRLKRLPIRISEVPMVLDANKRKGASKIKRRKTIKGYMSIVYEETLRDRQRDRQLYRSFTEGGQ